MIVDKKDVQVIDVVYGTYNYDLFKRQRGNRTVESSRVDNLVKSLSEQQIKNPIVVNSKFEIVEGQGRYEACKRLGLQIQFVIDEKADEKACVLLNRYNKAWTGTNFIRHYADLGVGSYTKLEDIVKESDLSVTTICNILKGKSNGKINEAIKDGQLEISQHDADRILLISRRLKDVLMALGVKTAPASFHKAFAIVSEADGYNHAHMKSACEKNRYSFKFQRTMGDNIKAITEIYNKGRRDKVDFYKYMENKGYNVRDYDREHHGQPYIDRYMQKDVSTLK